MRSTSEQGTRGFTLVEMAIVLVIIGLIIGGVVKGQALIEQARTKRAISQVDNYRAAIYAFQDKYGMLPGDENINNIPDGDSGNGDGDGVIENGEDEEMWNDLYRAEFISGNFDGAGDDSRPRNPFGGDIQFYNIGAPGGDDAPQYFILNQVPADSAWEIEQKVDGDGNRRSGPVRADGSYTGSGNVTLYIEF